MSFALTIPAVQEMLDDEISLQTLSNQFSTQEIFDMLQNKETIVNDDGLFNALMDAMYASRPQGVT
jgi:hypothetical protein